MSFLSHFSDKKSEDLCSYCSVVGIARLALMTATKFYLLSRCPREMQKMQGRHATYLQNGLLSEEVDAISSWPYVRDVLALKHTLK